MKQLMDEFDAAKAHETKLSDEFDDADRKCKRDLNSRFYIFHCILLLRYASVGVMQ